LSGNEAVWEKYVAADIIYTDENWRILTKAQLLDSVTPFPKGYSGSIRIADVRRHKRETHIETCKTRAFGNGKVLLCYEPMV